MTRICVRIFLCVAISDPISAIAQEAYQEAYQDRATADLENRLVEAPDLRIYLIKNGHRSLILNPAWIGASAYASQQPIRVSQTKIQSLPFGPDLTYISFKRQIATAVLFVLFLSFFVISRFSLAPRFGWTRLTRAVIFAGFVGATILRDPSLFLHPRFWAEEGTSWFQYAASHSAISTLFYVQPFTGYFNLIANLGAIAAAKTAAWFGLQFAPYATTILAFLIQIFAFGLILFGRSTLFDSMWKAAAGCAIALFAATATDEIWLTTINVITYMGFISLVFLFERTWEWPGYWKWVSRGMLALCALSSPYSAALVPLFVILALHGKYKEQRIQSAALIACLVVQAGVCVDSKMHATAAWGLRAKAIEPAASFITVFCEDMVRPAVGDPAFDFLIGHLGLREAWTMASSFPPRPHAPSAFLAAWICSLLAACILWALKGPSIFSPPSILVAAFLSICALVSLTAMESTPLGRYAFLPGAIFLLLLVLAAESCKTPAVSFAILMILSLGLANGLLAHVAANTQKGPSWSTEVRLWRADHSHSIRVWPEGWVEKGGAITLR